MDELALIARLNSLEARWSSLDSWLKFWISLVVLGLAVELVVILVEYFHERREFRRGIIRPPDRPSRVLLTFALLGAGLVALGVAGEFAVHLKAGKVETDIRGVTFALVAIANGKADGAEREAAQLRRDESQLRKDAESERLERVKIEARVAWRHLTDQQKADIGARLAKRFSNQFVSVWYNGVDIESSMFAADIAEALQAARALRVQLPSGTITMQISGQFGKVTRMDTGVIVQSTNDERSRSLADAIITELNVRGFDAARQKDPPFDKNPAPQVWVNVESRPNGPQGEFKLAAEREAKVKNKSNGK